MEKVIIKFNGSRLALLCSNCSKIIKEGFEFTPEEKQAARGERDLPAQYCEQCVIKENKLKKVL